MFPKPPPPRSLLLRNQVWVVIPARDWAIGGNTCYFASGTRGFHCGNPAVIYSTENDNRFFQEGLCVEHMGSHLWIGDDGILYQWRASPPYTKNKIPRKYERNRRG
jgi:hypothetical protein